MVQAGYIPRYGFHGIYQPRDFVARYDKSIETITSVYNLYLESLRLLIGSLLVGDG